MLFVPCYVMPSFSVNLDNLVLLTKYAILMFYVAKLMLGVSNGLTIEKRLLCEVPSMRPSLLRLLVLCQSMVLL